MRRPLQTHPESVQAQRVTPHTQQQKKKSDSGEIRRLIKNSHTNWIHPDARRPSLAVRRSQIHE